MNLAKSKSKYLKCAIFIISICILLGALSACLPFNISLPDTLKGEDIDNTAATITPNASDGFGEFNNGYSYVYTNKDLVENYRAGDPSTPYDISIVKVDTSQARGTQKNPYVIASIDDWEIFVKFCGTDLTKSTGKYFVLASDLDFDGKTFNPVGKFGGTFYGMGHSLKNISCDTWQYWNGTDYVAIGTSGQTNSGFGVFCSATNATITDLINQDFSYSGIPQTESNGVESGRGPYMGGILGVSFGNNFIMNCHTSGENNPGIRYSIQSASGGVVGEHTSSGSNKTIYLYRCSSSFKATLMATNISIFAASILAQSLSAITILDCVGNSNITSSTSGTLFASSIFGWSETTEEIFRIENVVGKVEVSYTNINGSSGLAGIRGNKLQFANAYVEGSVSSSSQSLVAVVKQNTSTAGGNMININNVKSSNGYAAITASSASDGLAGIVVPTEYPTSNEMISAAKTFFGASPYSNIWDVDKIGGSYDPDNTPVRNYLMAFIDFRNLNNSGNGEEKVGLDDGEPYIAGDKLPDNTSDVTAFTTYLNTKASANHVFLGWTDDKTGASKPFTSLPSGYFGEITLYAVWGLPDSYVTNNIKTSITSDKDKIEYDSVESITLTAKVDHTPPSSGGMTNAKPTYYFIQNGEEKTTTANVKNSGVLSVKTVKDSG
ncbi:MAG: hypothetical protein K2K85_08555, partial [Clostridia bacterium]|nr:hypothetical protein [Clostridia bacterium]